MKLPGHLFKLRHVGLGVVFLFFVIIFGEYEFKNIKIWDTLAFGAPLFVWGCCK